MNINEYVNEQKFSHDTDKTKLQLLQAATNLLLSPSEEYYSGAIKFTAILAKTFHIEIKQKKIEGFKSIDKAILYKLSEIIQNKHGYIELIPEFYNMLKLYKKEKLIQ